MFKKVEQKTENSHPGLAEPVEEELEALEESMKKLNFYKVEKPTTDSGLSTWILLSGQGVTTISPAKPSQSNKNASIVTNLNGSIKPVFKRRPAPSTKATTIIALAKVSTTPTPIVTSTSAKNIEKTTMAIQNKTSPIVNTNNRKNFTMSNPQQESKRNRTQELVKISTPNRSTTTPVLSTTELVPELKEGELELPSSTANPKKSRRPGNKKKKDKNRRKRPSAENKTVPQNKTKISNKVSQKEKPISTQIYNYLAREVMPTVGVGLVGLVVTAGLASYFLYPFSGLRRSYEIDRRDKDPYYYDNSKVALDYDSGIAEEEAIGKVIAGMPFSSTNFGNNNYHQQKNSRNSYNNNNRYRHVDSTSYSKPINSPETIHLHPIRDQHQDQENYIYDTQYSSEVSKNEPITYNKNVMSQNIEEPYNTGQQFVVGSVPKEVIEEVTPAAVPEHGPRNLKIRKRRDIDETNEIDVDETPQKLHEAKRPNVEATKHKVKVNNTEITKKPTLREHMNTFMDALKDLFTAKLKVVVELLQTQTKTFSRYLNSMHDSLKKLEGEKNVRKD